MHRRQAWFVCLVGWVVVGGAVEPAAAGFWRDVARGLQYAGWRPIDGGEIAVVPSQFGDGWTVLTTKRLDGESLYGGVVGIDLFSVRDPLTNQLVPVNLNTEFSARRWVIPTAKLRIATDQTGTNNPSVIGYDLWFRTGALNVEARGEGSLEMELEFNALGFYSLDAFNSNRGELTLSGLLADETRSMDYDIGPVSVEGHVLIDGLYLLMDPVFESMGAENPFAAFSSLAKLQNQLQERDMLLARLDAGETLTDEEMQQILTTSLMESMLGGTANDRVAVAIEQLSGTMDSMPEFSESAVYHVPEPVSMGLWLLPVLSIAMRRRRPAEG